MSDTINTFDYTGILGAESRDRRLSTRALAAGLGLCAAALILAAAVHGPWIPQYHVSVARCASAAGVEPELVLAMISTESRGREGAVSPKGAVGLMQILPSTAREIAAENGMRPPRRSELFDPDTNIRLGVAYLAHLLKRYDNDVTLALGAYNAGPRRIHEWRSRYPDLDSHELCMTAFYSETRAYVISVLARRESLKKIGNY